MSKFDKPADVSKLDQVFGGGSMDKLMPPYAAIPEEFKDWNHPWSKWQGDWFYSGLKEIPEPRDGIDAKKAMAHLSAIQGSWAPKHEHKAAGVAYLASLWFVAPSKANSATA